MSNPLRFPRLGRAPAPLTDVAPPALDPGPAPRIEDPQFNAAKRLYAEMFGDAIVTNTYLKIAVLALSLIVLFLIYSQIVTIRAVRNFQPLVIRIDQLGRAEAVRYDAFTYTPQEAEIKYFLSEFCRLYYSRNKASLASNFERSLRFFSPQLAQGVLAAWEKTKTIDQYQRGNVGDIDIDVRAVSIEDLRAKPLKARVDFYQVYYSPRERLEARRALYTANFTFRFREGVLSPQLLAVNPLGLTIEYFREDAALK